MVQSRGRAVLQLLVRNKNGTRAQENYAVEQLSDYR
jgi:hypothetical protein